MSLKYSYMTIIEFYIFKPYSLKMRDSSVEKRYARLKNFPLTEAVNASESTYE